MRVAVLSDIHANLTALEAVLAAVAPIDAVWHLGDTVGYGPQPNEVVERLTREGAVGVRGNHDSAATGLIDADWFNEDARVAVEWTARVLTPASRAALLALPERRTEDAFTLVHGSPRDPIWEYIASTAVARAALDDLTTPYGLFGHTHDPRVFRAQGGTVETLGPSDQAELQLDDRRVLLNPGSVGQPRDGDPRASALVLDLEARRATWHRVAYDIPAVQARMREVGLPKRLVDRLDRGL
ncbi:MAG TPA: metallophosphoesterase family protein [Candidatus Limnocylindrales bacterium]